MDHSVRGYLSRRTTGELKQILQLYWTDDPDEWEREVIGLVLEILYQRGEDPAELLNW